MLKNIMHYMGVHEVQVQHNVYCAQHYCLNLIIMIPAQESRLCIGGLEDQTTSLSYLLANHVYVLLPTCGFGV